MSAVRKRILIVEDESDLRELLAWSLAQAGFEVAAAEDGEIALRNARAARPDLVLLDLMLPKLDGLNVCRRLRSEPATADVPVIIVTASDAPDSPEMSNRCGATDYIPKPFSIRNLKQRIEAALGIPA